MVAEIVGILILAGLLLWALGQVPMDATVLRILRVFVIVCLVLWILQAFGLLPGAARLR